MLTYDIPIESIFYGDSETEDEITLVGLGKKLNETNIP